MLKNLLVGCSNEFIGIDALDLSRLCAGNLSLSEEIAMP